MIKKWKIDFIGRSVNKLTEKSDGGFVELFEAIKKRRSVRRYLDKPVEEDKLQAVQEAVK